MTDRNELRRLAEAALNPSGATCPWPDVDNFTDAASPEVVLGLLDEIDKLNAEIEDRIKAYDICFKQAMENGQTRIEAERERDHLRAALESIATHNPAVTHGWAVHVREMARNALRGEASGTDYRAVAVRLKEALEIVAAQTSGIPGSTARADCMASIASIALADPEVEKL